MTRTTELKSVNCTSCGAGLDVLGGGRVIVHICPYCGAELDAQHDYALLNSYDKRPRPDTPFALGATGHLMGVEWQIIGTIGKREEAWQWVEHQLFSPTHGYAWLSWDSGHATFARRVRKPSTPAWIDSRMVNAAEHPPTVLLEGARYVYYETSTAQITYLEGEFTWAPRMGQSATTVSLLSDDAMLDFSTSRQSQEREMYRSVWVSPDRLKQGFGLDSLPSPAERHPLQPFSGGQNDSFVFRAAALFAAASLIMALFVAITTSATTVLPRTFVRLADLPQTVTFDVTRTDRLVRVDLESSPANAWLFVGLEVLDPEGETLFESGRSMEFYSGRDSEGSWSEGNRKADLQFRPPLPGTYQIILTEAETELWGSGSAPTQFGIAASEGLRAPGWLVMLAVLFAILALVPRLRRFIRNKRRFAGSDWSED